MKNNRRTLSLSIKVVILLLSLSLGSVSYAQHYHHHHHYNPYNPYNNPYLNAGAQLGQAIGSAIATNQKYGRNNFRNQIKKWGACKTGTISLEHGAVAVYSANGYTTAGQVDERLTSKLKSINQNRQEINDVHISENGYFIVVFDGGKQWYGAVPTSVSSALNSFPYGTQFRSVSFNESGTYAITTSNGFKSNNATYQAFYDDNIGEYGDLLSVNVYGDGAVFCYENATKFCGSVPTPVVQAVNNYSYRPSFVKFNRHGDYLICTKGGSYTFNIPDGNVGSNAAKSHFNYASERKQNIRKRAIAKYDGKVKYKFSDENKMHRVFNSERLPNGDFIVLETTMSTDPNAAPALIIDFMNYEKKYDDILNKIPEEGTQGNFIKIELSNGEVLTSNEVYMHKGLMGLAVALGVNLVKIKSDRRTLNGTLPSIRTLVELFSTNNIKSITFNSTKVDMTGFDSKNLLCYLFYRLAREGGRSDFNF